MLCGVGGGGGGERGVGGEGCSGAAEHKPCAALPDAAPLPPLWRSLYGERIPVCPAPLLLLLLLHLQDLLSLGYDSAVLLVASYSNPRGLLHHA